MKCHLGGGVDPGGAPTPGGVDPFGAVAVEPGVLELEPQPSMVAVSRVSNRIRFINFAGAAESNSRIYGQFTNLFPLLTSLMIQCTRVQYTRS